MNKVFSTPTDINPLSPEALAVEANKVMRRPVFTATDFPERITGNHCWCGGNGEFVLEPVSECLEGGKRYMKCRICGGYSHL